MIKYYLIYLLIIFISISCKNKSSVNEDKEIIIKNVYDLDVKEPSGLAFLPAENNLLTVSDQTGKIYKITNKGEIIEILDYYGNDLEGITFDNYYIFVIEEKNRKIVKTEMNGNFIEEYNFPEYNSNSNSGPEGITYNFNSGHFYILNEKSPGMLVDWFPQSGVSAEYDLSFADDYSGICYDKNENALWIISDNSKTLSKCNLTGKVIKTYKINIEKAEGIAINSEKNEIYIVSDSEEKLYVLEIK